MRQGRTGRTQFFYGGQERRYRLAQAQLFADSAGRPVGRFSQWWRSVWVSVFGERGFHTSVALAITVLLGCQKRENCTLGQLMSPRSESVFFASFLCRIGQRNDVPPRTVANSDKENSQLRQTTNTESSNPSLTQNRQPENRTTRPPPPPPLAEHGHSNPRSECERRP